MCDCVWTDMKRHKQSSASLEWLQISLVQRHWQPSVQLRGIAAAPSPGRPTRCAKLFPSYSGHMHGEGFPFLVGCGRGQSSAAVRFCRNWPPPFAVNQAWTINSVLVGICVVRQVQHFVLCTLLGMNLMSRCPAVLRGNAFQAWCFCWCFGNALQLWSSC